MFNYLNIMFVILNIAFSVAYDETAPARGVIKHRASALPVYGQEPLFQVLFPNSRGATKIIERAAPAIP